jgi:hypothetical protein
MKWRRVLDMVEDDYAAIAKLWSDWNVPAT